MENSHLNSDTTLPISLFSYLFTQQVRQRHARGDVGVVEVDEGLDLAEVDEADGVLEWRDERVRTFSVPMFS